MVTGQRQNKAGLRPSRWTKYHSNFLDSHCHPCGGVGPNGPMPLLPLEEENPESRCALTGRSAWPYDESVTNDCLAFCDMCEQAVIRRLGSFVFSQSDIPESRLFICKSCREEFRSD